mmetsp:Transcript_19400/g.16617  ORF Transcript_19400/g.16617 Transcript_19400/m.16617 type:complete len:251 (+) Transcript_19400:474-1226(+)
MAFHFEFLKQMTPEIVAVATQKIQELKVRPNISKVDIVDEFQHIAGDVIGRVFFGEDFTHNPRNKHFTEIVGITTRRLLDMEFLTPYYFMFGIKFIKAGIFAQHRDHNKKISALKSHSMKLVKEKMENIAKEYEELSKTKHRKNLIEIFYEQRKTHPDDPLTDNEIRDLFLNFYVAGMDTTASLVSMASYYAMKNPECKKKILQEMSEVLRDPASATYDDISKLNYTTAFLKEVMRFSGPAPMNIPRTAT